MPDRPSRRVRVQPVVAVVIVRSSSSWPRRAARQSTAWRLERAPGQARDLTT
jgi:hypothetical protein